MTIPLDLDELERLAKAATPGHRRVGAVEKHRLFVHWPDALGGPVVGERVLLEMNPHYDGAADLAFLAAANPQTVLALVEEVRRLRAFMMAIAKSDIDDNFDACDFMRTTAENALEGCEQLDVWPRWSRR